MTDMPLETDSTEVVEKSPLARRFRGFLPVVVDVETAGFNPRTDALLEVAAVIIGMNEAGEVFPEHSQAFNVAPFEGANLEQAALDFTGIDPHNPLRGALDEEDALRQLFQPEKMASLGQLTAGIAHEIKNPLNFVNNFAELNAELADEAREALDEGDALRQLFQPIRKAVKAYGCNRAVLVGHNAFFDHSFLFAAAERAGIKRNPFHPFSTFDTATLAALAYEHTVLSQACKRAGIDFDNKEAHSALYDAEKTAELFCRIVNRWKHLVSLEDETMRKAD